MQELEISKIEAYPIREPVSRRSYTVIKVQTKSGLTGYGECAGVQSRALARAAQTLAGRQATAFEAVRRDLADSPGLQAGVNIALLDLVGKFSKAPVYQLLGGPTRNKVRTITSLDGTSEDLLKGSLKRAAQGGFRAVMVPLPPVLARNQGQAFASATRKRMESLRADAGDEMDFVLDGAGGLSPGDAASVAGALERFHLLWLEEPCKIANLKAVGKIASETVTPLGFGRTVNKGADFQELLREQVIDILRPSLGLNGISQIRRMAALAETYYVAVAPFHNGGPIGTAAALHLAASLPNFFIQQIPFPEAEQDRRVRTEMTSQPIESVKDGYAQLPTGPGLGISVNEDALKKYKDGEA